MPVVTVFRNQFLRLVGKTFTEEEFDELCFQFGLELDDVTSEAYEVAKGKKQAFDLKKEHPEKIQWKIEVPANRYDLLCPDGLARAFRIFLGLESEAPHFVVRNKVDPVLKVTVTGEANEVRRFMVCAVLRDIDFTRRPGLFLDFLNLQDKLHTNICRKRKLVSIGTHDLDKVQGPFVYTAENPRDIQFVPLQRNWMQDDVKGKSMNGLELFALLRSVNDPCASYLHLIEDSPKWPVFRDARGQVLSLPPILNGNYSAMSEQTKNVLIDVTAIDYTKALIVLNTIIAMFTEFCAVPFSAEEVEVIVPGGISKRYPRLDERIHNASLSYINSILGLSLKADEAIGYIRRMGLRAKHDNQDTLAVSVPITRSDVMHECDVAEDVAIAFGYGNLKKRTPFTKCFGAQQELNKFTDLIRQEIARCNYAEVLTEVLVSWEENYDKLRKPRDDKCVVLSAPKSREFEIARTSIIPGILKSLRTNRSASLPLRLFQVDDVVLRDPTTETAARNERRICAAYCNKSSGLEHVHGLLDKLFEVLGVKSPAPGKLPYTLKESDDATFFPGRCVTIHHGDEYLGIMGVIHPLVLKAFQLPNPVSLFEVNLEKLERIKK